MLKYAKFIAVLVGALLMTLDHYVGPGNFASQIIVYVLTGFGVWAVPNRSVN
jgi:hypothetical protein